MAVLVLLLAGYYVISGNDPLGLFEASATRAPDADAPFGAAVEAGGDWWRVYFTTPGQGGDPTDLTGSVAEKLIARINGARATIHVAAFEFDLTPVAEALIAAHERGVEVRWITDDEHGIDADGEEGHGQFAQLEDAGIEVIDDRRGGLMHNKFWIFDAETVWTGSTNITVNGAFRNNNNVLVLEVPAIAVIYEQEFAEMWDGQFGPRSPSTVDTQAVTVSGTPVRVLFAPEDDVVQRLVPIIEEAEDSVRFMAFSFTHDDLGQAMLARARAGVDVKGIFETRASETEYSELPRLYCADVPVRQDGNPRTFHHKVIIVDEATLVTGSLNFSESADDRNDENVVILTHPDIAAQYLQEFNRRWAEATPPDPADITCP
jgi:phosphatidylserine/phosphatidylglycerophosphate/cardiolipin synthase-like enzyme